jgi:hypothetical protein
LQLHRRAEDDGLEEEGGAAAASAIASPSEIDADNTNARPELSSPSTAAESGDGSTGSSMGVGIEFSGPWKVLRRGIDGGSFNQKTAQEDLENNLKPFTG